MPCEATHAAEYFCTPLGDASDDAGPQSASPQAMISRLEFKASRELIDPARRRPRADGNIPDDAGYRARPGVCHSNDRQRRSDRISRR